jgi:hypothetical protein
MPATSLSLSTAFNSSALDLVAICYELLLFFLSPDDEFAGRSVGF